MCGMQMATTCSNLMDLPFMSALMGMFAKQNNMWLNVGPSNNNLALIAGYYLDCVKTVGGWQQRFFMYINMRV